MKHCYKFRLKKFFQPVTVAFIVTAITCGTNASGIQSPDFRKNLTNTTDTVKPRVSDSLTKINQSLSDTSSLPAADSLQLTAKTDTFNLKLSKDSLEAPLKYEAADSVVVLIQGKKIIMYGKTKTNYQTIELSSPRVEMDQQTQIVTAVNSKDSTGLVLEPAHFKDGENEFYSDTIRYNFKSQIGVSRNTSTQQGEFIVHSDRSKKVDANTTYIQGALFTTCDLDDPHFGIKTGHMKVVNKKLAVSGPAHLEFEGVPIPIYLPFGFYPLNKGQHSGLLPPQFANNEQYGLGLEGLGYYKVLSPYWDVKVYGNIYSYGGWSLNVNPTYRRRYHYSGAFNVSLQTTSLNFKGDPDYLKNKSFFVTWNHSVDSKARPGTTFSANVNAGSTKFNQLIPNNPRANFNNQLGSSIAYSKSWAGKPYNLTLAANHNQNNSTRLVNISLPDASFTVNTIYPFENKQGAGTPKWYEKLGVGYYGNFRNQVSFYDTAFKFKNLIDTLQWGAMHNFPISISLPALFNGALIVAPSVSYSQVWIAQKFHRKWNPTSKKVDTTITKGLFIDQQASFSIAFNTAVYGTKYFKHLGRVVAIRHVMRPTLSMNYRPDLSKQHYYSEQVDTTGYKFRFTEFEGALYSGFGEGRTGGVSFQLDNNLEMKWRSKKDTGDQAIKKIKLIDGYGFNTGYNFLRDSLKLDMINFYLRTTLFDKINITGSAILDPYLVNERGQDIDKFAWQSGKFNLGRIRSGSLSISTSFRSKVKDPKKEEERKKQAEQRLNDPNLIADQNRLLEFMQNNPSDFVDFNIPWQVSFSYSLYFSQRLKADYSGFEKDLSSNLNFNGSFNLTPKWNFSANGYYDFDTKKLQTFTMSINREMHCWQLSINVTPIGSFRYFNFSISPKSAILQDLKINRTRYFTSY